MLILALFYDSVVKMCGDIAYYVGEGMLQKGIAKGYMERIVKEAGKIIGVLWQDLGSVFTDLLIKKLHHIVHDVSHPLYDRLSRQLIARSGCMLLPSTGTSRYLSSFVPKAIWHHNGNYTRGDVQIEMHRCMLYYFVFEHSCL